jgi:NADP-dependent 3-hydroxy acid dehydrogenase YdfG
VIQALSQAHPSRGESTSGTAPTTVLITGTNSGFGEEAAQKLASEGHRVFGTMRDTERRNARAKDELEFAGVTVIDLDVTETAAMNRSGGLFSR